MDETPASPEGALAAAEEELSTLMTQAGEAYRRWRALDGEQTAKAREVRDLRWEVQRASIDAATV